jgi:hypothetical protein
MAHLDGTFHSWSWGLDAAPLSPGAAYTLNYDPRDAELFERKSPDRSIRPMDDRFYVVRQSEDGRALETWGTTIGQKATVTAA